MPTPTSLCLDCQSNESTLVIRKRRLCASCFQKYIASKILKRMETYRFKNQVGDARRRLLLPVSGSASPLVLLEVLDKQIQKQLRQQGRTAYEIVVCHVDVNLEADADTKDSGGDADWYSCLTKHFSFHTCLPIVNLAEICQVDTCLGRDLTHLGISRSNDGVESDREFITRLLASARTVTARADIASLLMKRLIVSIARQNSCTSVLWGYSDSKLAAKALAEVAKGRGGAVSSDLADGPSAWELDFNYPLRDLYDSELELYLDTLEDRSVKSCRSDKRYEEADAPVSLRMTSIDVLLSNYINSQGEKYPSIMANVVRTASKLQVPDLKAGNKCGLCAMSIPKSVGALLCYGCERMIQDIKP